jgi:hypothetical protein
MMLESGAEGRAEQLRHELQVRKLRASVLFYKSLVLKKILRYAHNLSGILGSSKDEEGR